MRIMLAIISLIVGSAITLAPDAAIAKPRVYGAQLYTVRAALEADFDATLMRVADIGYREVEFAGLFGRDAVQVRKTLKRLGLRATSSLVDWKLLRDDPARLIAQTKALGARYMVLAWIPPEERQTIEEWRGWITHLNKVGATARAAGVQLAYHAHDFEYRAIDGVRPIDLLQTGLNARDVVFELDIYWAVLGGADPVALLRAQRGRYPLAHVKDMARTDTAMADVGAGRIDFNAIFAAAGKRDFAHLFVEHDSAADPFASLANSLANLKTMTKN